MPDDAIEIHGTSTAGYTCTRAHVRAMRAEDVPDVRSAIAQAANAGASEVRIRISDAGSLRIESIRVVSEQRIR